MHHTGDHNQDLRRVLNFTEEDLTANRQGQITNAQRFHLIKRTSGYFLIVIVVMTVFFLVTSGFGFFLQILGYYALLILIMLPWLAFVSRRVKSVEGTLTKHEQTSHDPREPIMNTVKVKGLEFSVQEAIFDCFVESLTYRIFYTAIGKLIVSAEQINQPDTTPIQGNE